jgi:hypothetical protein
MWRLTLLVHASARISDNNVSLLNSTLERCLDWFRAEADDDDCQVGVRSG